MKVVANDRREYEDNLTNKYNDIIKLTFLLKMIMI